MRKRHQSGSIQKAVSGKRRVWAGLYYDVSGKRKYVVLGNRREMTESQARTELEKILSPVNQARATQQVTRETTVSAYVAQVTLSTVNGNGRARPLPRRSSASSSTLSRANLQMFDWWI